MDVHLLKIRRVGKSLVISLPKEILAVAGMDVDDRILVETCALEDCTVGILLRKAADVIKVSAIMA